MVAFKSKVMGVPDDSFMKDPIIRFIYSRKCKFHNAVMAVWGVCFVFNIAALFVTDQSLRLSLMVATSTMLISLQYRLNGMSADSALSMELYNDILGDNGIGDDVKKQVRDIFVKKEGQLYISDLYRLRDFRAGRLPK
jgi:hypothetical protein